MTDINDLSNKIKNITIDPQSDVNRKSNKNKKNEKCNFDKECENVQNELSALDLKPKSSSKGNKSNKKINNVKNKTNTKTSCKSCKRKPYLITIDYENRYKLDDNMQQVGDNFSDENYIVGRYEDKWFKIKISP